MCFVTFFEEKDCDTAIAALHGQFVAELGPAPLEANIVPFLEPWIIIFLDYKIVRFRGSFISHWVLGSELSDEICVS